jgi:SAM-dependent methyltransferase
VQSKVATQAVRSYYKDKLDSLRDLFGTANVGLEGDCLVVEGARYPIVDDVIILLSPSKQPRELRARLAMTEQAGRSGPLAEDVQFSFGAEWREFSGVVPEHEAEFQSYFDQIDLQTLAEARVGDLGCGSGRWSHHLRGRCRELVLVDFSDAIFVARRNLGDRPEALFFMADVTELPFRPGCLDLVVCLGVLHHLPIPALDALRRIAPLAPRHLVYLYYALDNRPLHFRLLLGPITAMRSATSRIKGARARTVISWAATIGLYMPLLALGKALRPLGLHGTVPLYDSYGGKSVGRIRQDAYDRLFTRIEQRFTRGQIESLVDTFDRVTVADTWPYWHFVCEGGTRNTLAERPR